MQGHSGSGKTTFIKEIGKLGYNEGIAISTDDYFFNDEENIGLMKVNLKKTI